MADRCFPEHQRCARDTLPDRPAEPSASSRRKALKNAYQALVTQNVHTGGWPGLLRSVRRPVRFGFSLRGTERVREHPALSLQQGRAPSDVR